jgi:carboxylate-amine ligase
MSNNISNGSAQELQFRSSPQPTIGVELELQVLDRDTRDLVPGGLRILQACDQQRLENISGEFLLSMVEVKSEVCQDVAGLRRDLAPRLRRLRNIASSLGYDLAWGGTHPFTRPCMSAFSPGDRYDRIRRHHGWLAYQEAVFGLHVHVGVPDGDAAIGVANLVVPYLPHLLALSANSPFWQGVDTDYASARVRMFRPSASCGLPPHFRSWKDFEHYCQVLEQGGAIQSTKDLYWDIRPQPAFGTVEFRIFDVPATLSDVLALSALTRCLVINALRILKDEPELGEGDPRTYWLANENRWLASRYGLEAKCACRFNERPTTLSENLSALITRLQPIAEESGEADFISKFQRPEQLQTGAERQRSIYRDHGDWRHVLDDMASRWLNDLDDTDGRLAGARSALPSPVTVSITNGAQVALD